MLENELNVSIITLVKIKLLSKSVFGRGNQGSQKRVTEPCSECKSLGTDAWHTPVLLRRTRAPGEATIGPKVSMRRSAVEIKKRHQESPLRSGNTAHRLGNARLPRRACFHDDPAPRSRYGMSNDPNGRPNRNRIITTRERKGCG